MYRMKKSILIVLAISFQISFSQSEEKKYLKFNSFSNSTYEYEVGDGKREQKKTFIKEIKKDGDIIFYIKDKMFRYYTKSTEIDSCNIKFLKLIKFSDLKTLDKEVNQVNPLYPYKVFPHIYLVEKINDSTILKYKVKWEYYIE
jgi:hypothetical protein